MADSREKVYWSLRYLCSDDLPGTPFWWPEYGDGEYGSEGAAQVAATQARETVPGRKVDVIRVTKRYEVVG